MKRRVVIVGGGLAGVTTLHELVARDVEAVLCEAQDDLAAETSFANGGILSASAPDPWNGPGIARNLAMSLMDRDASLQIGLRALPGLAGWGLRFIRNATPARFRAATLANHALAALSLPRTHELVARLSIAMDQNSRGTLRTFATQAALAARLQVLGDLVPRGLRCRQLDRKALVALEPELEASADRLYGALHFPDDVVGDARLFVHGLAQAACRMGGRILPGTPIRRISRDNDGGFRLLAGEETLHATDVVIAAGTASSKLAAPLGIRLPVKPAKGYSMTWEAAGIARRPVHALVDEALHAVVVPLGTRIRVVAAADFSGEDKRISTARRAALWRALETLYPRLAAQLAPGSAAVWAGLRPMSVDGCPFIGPAAMPGLWVNAGHGPLGWTLAAGSALLLADLMTGRTPAVEPGPFSVLR